MKTYPDEITAAVLEKHAHLSDVEIARDIRDTEMEIAAYGMAAEGLALVAQLPGDVPEVRMHAFRASAWQETNRDRRAFVAFLRRLLDARAKVGVT